MVHWKKVKDGYEYNADGITLIGKEFDRIMSIGIEDGSVKFVEECDGYYSTHMSKQDAINALKEAIEWIEEEYI